MVDIIIPTIVVEEINGDMAIRVAQAQACSATPVISSTQNAAKRPRKPRQYARTTQETASIKRKPTILSRGEAKAEEIMPREPRKVKTRKEKGRKVKERRGATRVASD